VEESPSAVTPEEQQEVRRLIDAHEHTLRVCRACAETTRDLAWEVKRGSVPSADALAATLAEVERVLDEIGQVEIAIAEMKAALW
jgi:ATP-dependent protease Clp ATPase subunit